MPVKILPASGSGSATLISVAGTTTNDTLTLPAKTGNIITSADTGTVTPSMLSTGAPTWTSGGQVEFPDGTAAAPAITNSGDTNTGVFFPAADTIAFAEAGVESARIDSSGNLLVGTTSQPYSQVKSAVVGGAFYNQYSVTATTTATQVINAIAGMIFLRDSSVGGSAILVFDVTTGITILTQSGSVFTTSAPTGSQIQVSVGSSPYGLKLTAASGSNNHTVEIGTVLVQ